MEPCTGAAATSHEGRVAGAVTSRIPHVVSEPTPQDPKRALGPFRVAPVGYGAMRLTGTRGVRTAAGP